MRTYFACRRGISALALCGALLGVVLLSACSGPAGAPGTGSSGSTTAPDPTTIISNSKAATYADTSYTLASSSKAVSSGGVTLPATTTSGNGEITTNPKRSHLVMHITDSAGKVITSEVIADEATQTAYGKTTLPGQPVPTNWIKISLSSAGGQSLSLTVPDLSALQNVHLVGADTVNGVPVWHLAGMLDVSGEHYDIDYYVRQNTYLPAKIHSVESGELSAESTILFTKFNSGITISLPPASQVIGG